MKPTSKDITEAKEYLLKRLRAEQSIVLHTNKLIDEAVKNIINLAYTYNVPANMFSFEYDPALSLEVDFIINKLIDTLEEYTYELATYTNKENEKILQPYIYRSINGKTLTERMSEKKTSFKSEIGDIVKIALTLSLSKTKAITEALNALKTQSRVIKPNTKGMRTFHALLLLERHTIADAWMYASERDMIRQGAIGFYSYRGSSYPCQTCDENRGFHTFADPFPPYHPRCVCFAVPVFNT